MEYQFCKSSTTTKQEARRAVMKVTGGSLPSKAIIHHIDGDANNNSNSNLVACEDETYHKLLHTRTEALIACGNAHWRKCNYCGEYDDLKNMYVSPNGKQRYHKKCVNLYNREYKTRRHNISSSWRE